MVPLMRNMTVREFCCDACILNCPILIGVGWKGALPRLRTFGPKCVSGRTSLSVYPSTLNASYSRPALEAVFAQPVSKSRPRGMNRNTLSARTAKSSYAEDRSDHRKFCFCPGSGPHKNWRSLISPLRGTSRQSVVDCLMYADIFLSG